MPATIGKVAGAEYAVGGGTAQSHDFNAMMKSAAPLVFGFVLLFAFLLLLVAFRSIVVALKAILLNLLSVGAAYGMLVAIFQWGWGENILNFNSTGGIASWLPMFLFVILFGLSMDYHVFILSRVKEYFDRYADPSYYWGYNSKAFNDLFAKYNIAVPTTFAEFETALVNLVINARVMEASLAYFLTPLVAVGVGRRLKVGCTVESKYACGGVDLEQRAFLRDDRSEHAARLLAEHLRARVVADADRGLLRHQKRGEAHAEIVFSQKKLRLETRQGLFDIRRS